MSHRPAETTPSPAAPATRAGRPLPSLTVELLVNLSLLAIGAMVVAVGSAILFAGIIDSPRAPWYLAALIIADVGIFVVFGHWLLRRVVVRPMAEAVSAVEAVANGNLERRIPGGSTRELDALARSVNRMTDTLLAHQTQIVRAEKLASIGRLAAGIAHEIGNPLGALHGYVHLLRDRTAGDAGAVAALDGMEREVDRIDRIVRGLLDYARPRRLTPVPVDLNQTVHAVVHLLTNQGLLRRVTTQMELDPSAPLVFGERHELEQVFVNLMLNALDAMGRTDAGRITLATRRMATAGLSEAAIRRDSDPLGFRFERGPSPRVEAWLANADRPGWVVKAVVSDSGPGVPEGDVERIFDPFFTTKDPGQGTGLGLAIVSRIVENLGGTIWVERSREGGAAFHLVLPLHEVSMHAPAGAPGNAGTSRDPAAAGARR